MENRTLITLEQSIGGIKQVEIHSFKELNTSPLRTSIRFQRFTSKGEHSILVDLDELEEITKKAEEQHNYWVDINSPIKVIEP